MKETNNIHYSPSARFKAFSGLAKVDISGNVQATHETTQYNSYLQ